MLQDGWFPFVLLIGDGIDKIESYYKDKERNRLILEFLIESFDAEKIKAIIARWWKNELFDEKRIIIEAGISSFLLNTNEGYINAIKNLATEIEGIIRVSYHKDYNKRPSYSELIEYITKKGSDKFSSFGSLCFPEKFLEYLTGYIFKSFDIESDSLPESRHSVAHGVGNKLIYNKEFALKLILTLDNIFFFLGSD